MSTVDVQGEELIVTTNDGPRTIGPLAVALNGVAPVRNLTLRTPTLDDVFLKLTGNHITKDGNDSNEDDRELQEVGR